MKIKLPLCLFFTLVLFCRLYSQETADPALLTLDRIYQSADFSMDRFGPARWMDNGTAYTTLERSATVQGGQDILSYDTESGAREILVSASELVPPGKETPLQIADYVWSNDKKRLLIFTNTRRVWRRDTRGDYWVLDLDSGRLQQVGKAFPEASLMFAKFDPAARRVAYVSGHNLYVEDLSDGLVTALTTDGSETLINGTFDWAYEEEFGCRDGFRWSPNGTHIAFWQIDAAGIRDFLMINNTDSIYSYTIPVQYPKVGETPSGSS